MNEANFGLLARRDARRNLAQTPVINTPEPVAYSSVQQSEGGVGEILRRLRRRQWLMATVFVVVATAGVLLTLAQTPKYTSTALLYINPTPEQIVPERQLTSGRGDTAAVDSEIEVLKSPALAERLAAQLDLDLDAEWNPALQTTNATAQAGADARPTYFPVGPKTRVDAEAEGSSAPQTTPRIRDVSDSVVEAVGDAITVRRRGLSNVVEVSAESASPQRAAEMANGLSNIYLSTLSEARYDASERANVWLKDRLEELRKEVEQKQAAAQQYRAQRNLLTAEGVSLVEQQVAQIQSSLLQTRAQYAQKQSEHQQLASLSSSGKSIASMGNADDAMRDLRAKEAEVAQRIANLEQRYGAAYPALVEAKEEKAALDRRISDEMERAAAKAKVEMDSLGARLRTQEAELGSLRSQLVSGNFDQVRLDALETDANSAQSVYENFLQRYHEIARQGAATGVGARLLSVARLPVDPTSPHMLINAAITLAAGLFLAILAALIAEQFRGTVETTEEVEQRVGVRTLVSVPALRRRDLKHMPSQNRSPTAYLLTKRLSQFAEAFRVLQAAILLADGPRNKVVAITSAMPSEGKTTLAIGLARIAAIGGKKVIVVDCDIRMRSINRVLGITPTEGLQEVLTGERPWRDVVGVDAGSGAHVLPASGFTSKDLFSSGAMQKLVADLSADYDLVILDCAPVFAVAETRVVASLADSVVLTARARKTSARALSAAAEQLDLAGANLLGIVLNYVDARHTRRSFYDGLYYAKAFRGYYAQP